MTMEELWNTLKRDRTRMEHVVVSALTLLVSLGMGIVAHRRLEPLRRETDDFRRATEMVSSFRAAFRPMTVEQETRLTQAVDSLNLGVPAGMRLAVAEEVTRAAQSAGLRNVQVHFAPADSLYIPPRGQGAAALPAGAYTVVVDSEGDFAAAMRMLDALPSFVAVIKFTGIAVSGTERYRLTLAVYEAPNDRRPG